MAEVDPTMVLAESDMVREAEAYTSPYERWKRAEGLPTVRGYFVKNLLKLELAPWKSSGDGLAAIITWRERAASTMLTSAKCRQGKR
jgi:hypothetical protein